MSRVAHPDHGFDVGPDGVGDGGCGVGDSHVWVAAGTHGVVDDLGALVVRDRVVSLRFFICIFWDYSCWVGWAGSDETYLRITNQNNLCIRTPIHKVRHLAGDSLDALLNRVAVRGVPDGWIVDRLGGGARMGIQNQVDDCSCCAEARRGSGLSRAEDMDAGAVVLASM